jgi:hypothetical protein
MSNRKWNQTGSRFSLFDALQGYLASKNRIKGNKIELPPPVILFKHQFE